MGACSSAHVRGPSSISSDAGPQKPQPVAGRPLLPPATEGKCVPRKGDDLHLLEVVVGEPTIELGKATLESESTVGARCGTDAQAQAHRKVPQDGLRKSSSRRLLQLIVGPLGRSKHADSDHGSAAQRRGAATRIQAVQRGRTARARATKEREARVASPTSPRRRGTIKKRPPLSPRSSRRSDSERERRHSSDGQECRPRPIADEDMTIKTRPASKSLVDLFPLSPGDGSLAPHAGSCARAPAATAA